MAMLLAVSAALFGFTTCVITGAMTPHGAGSSGEVSGELDVDASIKFHVIVPQGRMSDMLDDVEA